MAGVKGIRLSLAGAQNKLPVYMEGHRIFIASGNAPSSHILKPPIKDLEDTVGNEAYCMSLAQRIGLPAPPVAIHQGLDRLFIVTCYDRRRGTGMDVWCVSIRRTSAKPLASFLRRNTKVKAVLLYRSALASCSKRASGLRPIGWPFCAGRSSIS